MDCESYRDDMLELLYGEAAEETRRRVSGHHEACRECREEFQALRGVRRDLAAWTLPVPARRRPSAAPSWLPLAAALVVALAGLALSRVEVSALRERVARLEAGQAALAATAAVPAAVSPDQELVARFERMVAESEARQARLVEASLAGLESRQETRRRYDMAQVSAGLSYLDGKTGLQMARTTELVGHVLQAAQER
jgi:anti-sigma factor RsiW